MEAVDRDLTACTGQDLKDLKVAFVHYWFVTWRGGEKVIESLLKLFPNADVYTLFYDPKTCGSHLSGHRVYTSCLNLPIVKKHYQKLFPFYPLGIKSLKLRNDYDLVISSESGPAKGIANPKGIPHLCYIHSPMRYCWGFTDAYLDTLPKWSRSMAKKQFERLRKWDLTTINNVDLYVANSNNVANRVRKYYNKPARICFPPIASELFKGKPIRAQGEYYLSFGAITPYKNVDLLVKAFNQSGKKLIVIGNGSERQKLEQYAKPNIQFLGNLPTVDVIRHIQHAKALLFPGEEDFGMIPLEVMSQGVPVIAYAKGGALESVVENRNDIAKSSGIFFHDNTMESLEEALEYFEQIENQFNAEWIYDHARSFGEERFQKEMKGHILDLLNNTY